MFGTTGGYHQPTTQLDQLQVSILVDIQWLNLL